MSFGKILPFLKHSDQGIRRASIEACGKIKGNEIIQPLKDLYISEEDTLNRLASIEAIVRLSDQAAVKETLLFFKSIEKNPLLLSNLNKTLNNMQ